MIDIFNHHSSLLGETWIPEVLRSKELIWVAAIAPLALVLAGTLYRRELTPTKRRLVTRLAWALAAIFLLLDAGVIAMNVHSPRDWDFKHFWTWGVAIAEGTSPYDHQNLLRIAEPINPSPALVEELYCFYPPPTLALFAPLGWMPFKTALLVWNLVQGAALAACVYLCLRLFTPGRSLSERVPIIALILSFWATAATFAFSQTNFLILLALLLFWRDRERPIAGLWLAVGILIKPLVASVPLYLLIRRRWSALSTLAGGLAVIVLLTYLAWGSAIFVDFVQREGISEQYLLTQDVNQSLSATLLRAAGMKKTAQSLIDAPLVPIAMVLLAVATGIVIAKVRGPADPYAVGVTFAMMLLFYPGTLNHYAVHLLPPVILLFCENQHPSGHRKTVLAIILVAFLFAAVKLTFVSTVLVWLTMAVEGLRLSSPATVEPVSELVHAPT